jgi:hypothetical protein
VQILNVFVKKGLEMEKWLVYEVIPLVLNKRYAKITKHNTYTDAGIGHLCRSISGYNDRLGSANEMGKVK